MAIKDQVTTLVFEPKSFRDAIINRIKSAVAPRTSPMFVGYLDDTLFGKVIEYKKETMIKMVKQLPDIRGALTVIVDAVVGDYTFITKEKGDPEKKDPKRQEIADWVDDPLNQFREFVRELVWTSLIRDNIFLELIHQEGKILPWMYILNSSKCTLKYNDKHTKIIGFDYKPDPNQEKPYQYRGDGIKGEENVKDWLHSAMDQWDGSKTGFPPLETLIEDANLYISARNYIKGLYKSGGLGRLAFIGEDITAEEYLSMKQDVKQSKGLSIALKGKIKIQNLSALPKDMMFKDIDDKWVGKVMTALSVPPVMMCKPESSFKEASKSGIMNVFSSKVRARQRYIEGIINQLIVILWGKEYAHIRFQLKPWVDPYTQAEIYEKLNKVGAILTDEIREEWGLPIIGEDWSSKYPYNYNFPPQALEMQKEMQQQGGNEMNPQEQLKELWLEHTARKFFFNSLKNVDYSG